LFIKIRYEKVSEILINDQLYWWHYCY